MKAKVNAKAKWLSLAIIATVVTICAILSVIFMPQLQAGIRNAKILKYTETNIDNIDNLKIFAHCVEIGGEPNSILGVQEAIYRGAQTVVVDICFRDDGTPVLTNDYATVNKADTLEDLMKTLHAKKYAENNLCLNIVQLSDIKEITMLAVQYDCIDRTIITGVDSDRYGMITSTDTIVPIYLTYKPSQEEIDAAAQGKFQEPECISEYGAAGLLISYSHLTPELIISMKDLGIVLIVNGLSNDDSICSSIVNGCENIYVDDILRTVDIIDIWTKSMQDRNISYVEKSVNNLSTTSTTTSE